MRGCGSYLIFFTDFKEHLSCRACLQITVRCRVNPRPLTATRGFPVYGRPLPPVSSSSQLVFQSFHCFLLFTRESLESPPYRCLGAPDASPAVLPNVVAHSFEGCPIFLVALVEAGKGCEPLEQTSSNEVAHFRCRIQSLLRVEPSARLRESLRVDNHTLRQVRRRALRLQVCPRASFAMAGDAV
jgi:hypothetical protein